MTDGTTSTDPTQELTTGGGEEAATADTRGLLWIPFVAAMPPALIVALTWRWTADLWEIGNLPHQRGPAVLFAGIAVYVGAIIAVGLYSGALTAEVGCRRTTYGKASRTSVNCPQLRT